MENFKPNQILCMNYNDIEKILPLDSVSLSIIFLPYEHINDEPYSKFESILEKIKQVTKPGGICCFFVENTIDPESDTMSMNATKSILEILDSQKDWVLNDKIIWIKSPRANTHQTDSHDSVTVISFEDTPFATIYVLVKNGSKFESVDFREKVQSLSIPQAQKDEIGEDFWYIQPSSEPEFTDRIPKELAFRLIMLFSNENDLILDPFCGNGLVSLTANFLNRKFLCIDENKINCRIANKRIKEKSP